MKPSTWLKIGGLSLLSMTIFFVGVIWVAEHSYDNRPPGGDFELTGVKGAFFSKSLRGKAVVLYFGFTSCPDVCPISLHKLSQVLKGLPEQQQELIVPVFVSVDSRGDTPEKAQAYVQAFYKTGVGLTGTKEKIDQVTDLYGASYMIEDAPKSALGYSVQHSTRFFLIDRKGKFQDTVPTEATNEELLKHLKEIL